MAEDPDAQAADGPAGSPSGKPFGRELRAERPARAWVTRAEAIALLALAFVFLAWVGVIVLRQRQAGRDIHWVRGQGAGAAYLIDINRAGPAELTLLPGVGPARAERIVKWRQEHGPFQSLDELPKAAGISAKDLAAIRRLVTLGEPTPEPPADTDYAEPDAE